MVESTAPKEATKRAELPSQTKEPKSELPVKTSTEQATAEES